MTRAAFAAGAPEVFDEVTVDGRFGIVLQRLDGPTLQQLLLTSAMTPEQVGAILASLYISVHKRRRRRMSPCSAVGSISHRRPPATYCRSTSPPASLTLIDRLPPEDGLCHSDLHPGNVIMTADGPKIIDWACALRASGVFDIARVHISLSELVPERRTIRSHRA